MSRRKQDKPQPRKRLGLVNSDADLLLQDLLTCGICQKEFVLSDIVKFIQHKVHLCNKENYKLQNNYDDGDGDSSDHSSPDAAAAADTKLRVSNKRPSISAPISRKTSLLAARLGNRDHRSSPSPSSPSVPISISCSSNETPRGHLHGGGHARNHVESFESDRGCKGVIGDLFNSSLGVAGSDRLRRNVSPHQHAPSFLNSLHNRCRTPARSNNLRDVAANTTITEPTSLICSTCKSTFSSAWLLVQHAQNSHGLKIYVDSSPSSGLVSNRSTPSASSVGGLPLGRGGERDTLAQSSASSLAPFLVGGSLSLETSPQPPRVPLGERQFGSSLNASSLFSRPSSQDIGLISEHYSRLNNHSASVSGSQSAASNGVGSLSITAAGGGGGGTTSATGPLSLVPFDAHHPFDRGGPFEKIRVPPLGLSFEPQLDFYSQRLRQLAGATSPNTAMTTAATPSPRKLTPPFGSGGSHHGPTTASSHNSSSEPSTPTPSQQTKDHQSRSGGDHQAQPHNLSSSSEKEKPPLIVLRSSSPSSNGSKGGDVQPGSPKLKACEFCGKNFRFQSNLIVHRRSHTGEKPFKCHICNHACTQASKLKRHMKTHRNKSPGDSTISENTSIGSARSTPDSEGRSRAEDGKDGRNENGSGRRRREREADDGNNSDSQAVEIEDDDDLDDLDEDEDEMEGEEEDENSTDLIAEDLTTNKSVGDSSNPADLSRGNNNNNNNKEPKSEPPENSSLALVVSRHEPRQSVLGEVMEKIGLSTIQQYNEAYRQALEESFANSGVKTERPSSSEMILPNSPRENGPVPRGEDGNKAMGGAGSVSAALDFGLSLSRAFDHPLEKKRLKLDHHHRGGDNSRESLYAGLWLPSVASSHRDLYYGVSSSDPDLFRLKTTSESALKSVTPGGVGAGRFSPRPGTSGSGVSSLLNAAAAAAAAASGHLSLTFPGAGSGGSFSSGGNGGGNGGNSVKPKTDRRNDTCEYCGKVFKNCSNLTVHRRSHTGEKPYKCELCSYACAQSSKLTRHMKTHGRVGKDVYRCRFCDMPFSVPSTLEKHMRKCVVNQNSSGGSALMDKELDYGKEDCGPPSNDGHDSSGRARDSDALQYGGGRSSAGLLSKDSSYKDDALSICEVQSEESRDDSRRDSDAKEVL